MKQISTMFFVLFFTLSLALLTYAQDKTETEKFEEKYKSGKTANGTIWNSTPDPLQSLEQIGHGTNTDKHLPIEPFYKYTYSQTIYLASDFGSVGSNKRITKIYYNFRKSSTNNNGADNWTIYMGTTSSNTISDWIPVTNLTKVFEGNTGFGDISTGDGWMEIMLETPFNYNPSTDGNLVVAVDENSPGYTSYSDDFYCDQNSNNANVSIYYMSDVTNPDPSSPPSGTTSSYYPNTKFLFEDIPTDPVFSVSPGSVDFGTVFLSESSFKQTITVRNLGLGTLQISATTITGTNSGDFVLTDNNSYPVNLSYGQTMTVQVYFAPTNAGTRSAMLRFTANATNHDVALTGTGYNATVASFPYNEPFTSFNPSNNATGFANNWRTYPSDTYDLFRWTPNSGSTPSSDTGPAVDHTSGNENGMYIYTEASDGSLGDAAYLYPPPFNLDSLNNPAVRFYYHMYGGDMGKLEFQVSTDGGSTWTTLVTLSGQQQTSSQDAWSPAYIDLSAYSGKTVKFRFKATRGYGYAGDMAIDDFYIGEKTEKKLDSVKVEQASASNVILGSSNNEILKLTFYVSPGTGLLPLNSITVTSGNDNDADIAENGVKLYRTSTSSFITDSLIAMGSYANGKVTFGNLNYNLPSGRSYFWVTYDIKETAALGDSMDAKILANDINVNGVTYNSVDADPPGKRTVCGLVLDSIKVEQASFGDVPAGSKDVPILKIGFYVSASPTSGAASLKISSFKVGVVTQNPDDISKIKLYRTESDIFNKDSLVSSEGYDEDAETEEMIRCGDEDIAPTPGLNYWVAYDLSNLAVDCDTLDAYIPANGITINGQTYNSHIENPTGYRIVRNYYHGGNGIDYGGYYFANSTSYGGPNRPSYNWIDTLGMNRIADTDWTEGNADDGYKKVGLPFSFNFFGQNYDTLCIGTNGMIGFGSYFPYTLWGTYIPSSDLPNNMIATAGMNLIPGSDGEMFYGMVDSNFVVTWYHYHHYAVPTEWITCQTILKPNGDIKMQYNYPESNFGPGIYDDALIGIENSDGSIGHQYRGYGFGGPIVDTLGGNTLRPSETKLKHLTLDNGIVNTLNNPRSLAIEYSKNKRITLVEPSSSKANIPLKYELLQNYPNPFNPATTIKFSIKKDGNVRLEVFNILGQKVAELLNKEMKAGEYKVIFDASNFSSGIYFYRIVSGSFKAVRKMILLK